MASTLAAVLTLSASPALAVQLLTSSPVLNLGNGVQNGAASGGYMVMSGSFTVNNGTLANYTIQGGSGSGGGGGFGGAVFVNNGASLTLNSVALIGNTAIGGTGGAGGATVGGTLNAFAASTSAGSNGAAGSAAYDPGFGDGNGNGLPGLNGAAGGAGSTGSGGTGGAGGSGGQGWVDNKPVTGQLAAATVIAALDVAQSGILTSKASTETAAAVVEEATAAALEAEAAAEAASGAEITAAAVAAAAAAEGETVAANAEATAAKDTTIAAFDTAFAAAYASTQLPADAAAVALATASLASWNAAETHGSVGKGGAGGAGGVGGAGSFGFGGGVGGAGGQGGVQCLNLLGSCSSTGSAPDGIGGAGGTGGAGGFGGGGGSGGNGGAANAGSANPNLGGAAGAGGVAGFGGGIGSTGAGTEANGTVEVASGGGGGSGYGGAIFVSATGTLLITGNSTFSNNTVAGGNSLNGGASGQAVGGDLFLMTGADVTLAPGVGNTIAFNDSIADDSAASISGAASTAFGAGATIKIGAGLVVFNATDTYSGQTVLQAGAVLQAADGVGLSATSNLNFQGGVLQTSGSFTRFLGTTGHHVQWTGSGGFAAKGGALDVTLNSGQQLTWGVNSFIPTASALLFGATSADHNVTFENAIDLGGQTRSILVTAAGTTRAVMAGVLSDGALSIGDVSHVGTLELDAINTYTGATTINAGTLALGAHGSIASSSLVTDNGLLDLSAVQGGSVALTTLAGTGSVSLGANTLVMTNASTGFAGGLVGTGGLEIAGGTQTVTGTTLYTGATTVDGGASLVLSGAGSIAASSGLQDNGTVSIAATTNGAAITTLSGSGTLALGAEPLFIGNAGTTFSGVIGGTGSIEIAAGTQALSGTDTFTGATFVDAGATLALAGIGSIAASQGVQANGTFDLSATTNGASIVTLLGLGSGVVTLGTKTLTLTNASTQFAGAIGGTGGIEVSGGTQTLSGLNGYTGATLIDGGASLALIGTGSLAASSGVAANGTFDISGATAPAAIKTLSGTGSVTLGANRLEVTAGSTTFAGAIGGLGSLEITGGTQILSGTNTFQGPAVVDASAQLTLIGSGSIATASGVQADGTFDLSGTTSGASIQTLAGAATGHVTLGSQRLALTDASSNFQGVVAGLGSLEVAGGTQVLTGANTYTGATLVDTGTQLALAGTGSIAASSGVQANGLFTIASTTSGASIKTLSGSGTVALGAQRLTFSNASTSFGGVIGGTGSLELAAGTQTLSGTNTYQGATLIDAGAALALTGTGAIAASSGVQDAGTFDISGTASGAAITTLAGSGSVALGSRHLTFSNASTSFAGALVGTGGIEVGAGTQTLTGANTYQGATQVDTGAHLVLTGIGTIATSSGLQDNGVVDLSGTTSGASIRTLSGTGSVALGTKPIFVTNASTTFAGVIGGTGAFSVTGGQQTLSGLETYTGVTQIDSGATLGLSGTGSIAASAGLIDNGTLSIAATTAGAAITTLSGAGIVALGSQTLTLTAQAGPFSGVIGGTGGLAITGGSATLTGTNTYSGGTSIQDATVTINADAALGAAGGPLAMANATLVTQNDIASARTITLTQADVIDTNSKSVTLSGTIGGTGALHLGGGGSVTLSGTNTYSGGTVVDPGTTLIVGTDAALGASSAPLVLNGTLSASGSFSSNRPFVLGATGEIDSNGYSVDFIDPVSVTVGNTVQALFTGSTHVIGDFVLTQAGGLQVSGNLRGVGTLGSSATISGMLEPGNSPGTITSAASVTMLAGSQTIFDTDGTGTGTGAGNYSRLIITGAGNTFTAAGTLVPKLRGITGSATNTFVPTIGQGFYVIQAEGGILGSFAGLQQPASGLPAGAEFESVYTANSISMFVTPQTYTDLSAYNIALTRNQRQAAHALDVLRPTPGVRNAVAAAPIFTALFTQGVAALPGVYDQVSGTIYGDTLGASLRTVELFGDTIAEQNALRRGLAADGSRAGAKTVDGVTAWIGAQNQQVQSHIAAGSRYRGSTWDATGGLEGTAANLTYGVATSYATGSIGSQIVNAKAATSIVQVGPYGSWTSGALFVDGRVSGNSVSANVTRSISALGVTAQGSAQGFGAAGALTVGGRFAAAAIDLEPTLGLRYETVGRKSLTETGANVVSLQVANGSADELASAVGLRARSLVTLGTGFRLLPSINVQWAHAFGPTHVATNAAFVGAPGAIMAVQSAKSGSDVVASTVGLGLQLTDFLVGSAFYRLELQREGSSQAFNAGLTAAW